MSNNLLTPVSPTSHWQKQLWIKTPASILSPPRNKKVMPRGSNSRRCLPCDIAVTVREVCIRTAVVCHPRATRIFRHHHEVSTCKSQLCRAKGWILRGDESFPGLCMKYENAPSRQMLVSLCLIIWHWAVSDKWSELKTSLWMKQFNSQIKC